MKPYIMRIIHIFGENSVAKLFHIDLFMSWQHD